MKSKSKQGVFRPCIDIHDGKVKQIVGGTLSDNGAKENFTSKYDAKYYAKLYKQYNLPGGHIILLDKKGTPAYDADVIQAKAALAAFPGGLQIGGGVDDTNAESFLKLGASHVIVTGFIFKDGAINFDNLNKICDIVTPKHLVLDLSVRNVDGEYYITTERWQKISNVKLYDVVQRLSRYSSEFLIHAADAEGKREGVERKLIQDLSMFNRFTDFPVTYAGGIKDMEDIEYVSSSSLNYTVGSALDIFGGNIPLKQICDLHLEK
jgi:phosphoribosylformimino-5-aminoimidazole carboxamide ribotide isomerase